MAEKSRLDAALDELLTGKSTEEIVGPGGVLNQLTKALLERAMGAELSNHLGYEKHDSAARAAATIATGRAARRCRATSARLTSKCRVTVTAASSRRFCPNTS